MVRYGFKDQVWGYNFVAFLFSLILGFFIFINSARANAFTVNNLGDASDKVAGNAVCETNNGNGVCTLRAAVEEANALAGSDTIIFSITGTINTNSVITITTPGNVIDAGSNHNVAVNGKNRTDHCFYINNAANNVIKGLVMQDCDYAVYIGNSGATANSIQNNYIGTDMAGDAAVRNNVGVYIDNGASGNYIGAVERNIISGNSNGTGIIISGTNTDSNIVANNYIGLNAAGTAILPNKEGIEINSGAQENIIGLGNIISGNTNDGIVITGANTSLNVVKGNYIGTGPDGSANFGNGDHGIEISNKAASNIIGGTGAFEPNLIRYNGNKPNKYGVAIEGNGTKNNKLVRNKIYNNQTGGINLTSGANEDIAQPIIISALEGGASSSVVLSGSCETDVAGMTIELFSSLLGQGQNYIGSATTTNGAWTYNLSGSNTAVGQTIVATATDSDNNTSAYSSEQAVTDLAVVSMVGTVAAVNERDTANLVGTASYDPNYGDSLTYLWERVSGESITILNNDQAQASFTALTVSADSSVIVRLTVNGLDSEEKTINIINTNNPPSLINIPDQTLVENVSENAKFDLDNYFVDNGDIISYSVINNLDPSLGVMDVNSDGTVDFNLAANAVGIDTIQFKATDEHAEHSESNIVTITISAAPEQDSDNQISCQPAAWPTGGSILRLVKLQNQYYIAVVKQQPGSTIHIYDIDCELVGKKKLSPKLHTRRLAVLDLLGDKDEEIIVSARRGDKIYLKIFTYDPAGNKWSLLKRYVFSNVPKKYLLEAENKTIFLKNAKERILHKWVF